MHGGRRRPQKISPPISFRISRRNSCVETRTIDATIVDLSDEARRERSPPSASRTPCANGGWSFAFDPDASPIAAPAHWRPELSPSTLPLGPPPSEFEDSPPIDPTRTCAIRADNTGVDGRYIILDDPDGEHRLCLRGEAGEPLAMILPIDGQFELRLRAAGRLYRFLCGQPSGPPPPGLAISLFQRSRLTLLLNIFDRLAVGRSKREIARDVIYPGLDAGSAAEWKASSERRRTQRLCDEAKAMVAAGYRRLLGGR